MSIQLDYEDAPDVIAALDLAATFYRKMAEHTYPGASQFIEAAESAERIAENLKDMSP